MTDPKHETTERARKLILEAYKAEGQSISALERESIDVAAHAVAEAVEAVFRVSAATGPSMHGTTAMLALAALSVHASQLAEAGAMRALSTMQ